MIKDVFKDSIWETSFKIDLNDFVKDYLLNNPIGRNVSNYGGYQSKNLDLTDPSLDVLITYITKQAYAYGCALNYNTKKYVMSNMWLNVNDHKDYNDIHIHGGGIVFAGVYYVNVKENQGDLVLTRHDAHLKNLAFNNHNYDNPYTWSYMHISPINYKCVLFPASMLHSVHPNQTNDQRISLSFNMIESE